MVGGLIPPTTRAVLDSDLSKVGQAHETVYTFLVSVTDCPTCGYDEFTDSSRTLPCTVCNDTGKIASITRCDVYARVNVIDLVQLDPYKSIPPGVESGDALVFFSSRDYDLFNELYNSEHGYIQALGQTFKVTGINEEGFGKTYEYMAICKKFKPTF
jgi:hypothetical protein